MLFLIIKRSLQVDIKYLTLGMLMKVVKAYLRQKSAHVTLLFTLVGKFTIFVMNIVITFLETYLILITYN